MQKKILIIANTTWYLYNFRLSLMKTIESKGYSVTAVAPADNYISRLTSNRFPFIPIDINRKGVNPLEDFLLFYRFLRIFKQERPAVILTYTPKPNIYASIAAYFLKIPVINNVAGLGNIFVRRGLLSTIVKRLYKIAFTRSYKVFFQNNDDLNLFVDSNLVKRSITERIPGSGVDTEKFVPSVDAIRRKREFIFLLIARLLWDKGVGDYVEAARLLKNRYPHIQCHIVGFIDMQNPEGIPEEQIKAWVKAGLIHYDGPSDNMIKTLKEADCIVLPSFYREGVPRVLLEAASMAKPVITTDSVGCRDAVEDGITGFLCQVKNPRDLADKMEQVLLLPEAERELMGSRGREKMIHEFDERFVIQRYLYAIQNLAGTFG